MRSEHSMALPRTCRSVAMFVATVVGAALALTGCASGETPEADSTSAATATADAFPVTLDTAFGEITVDEKPERIVVFGSVDPELLSYLGEEPFAWTLGPSTKEDIRPFTPWLEDIIDSLVDPDPSLYSMENFKLSPEAIALLEPDLILSNPWAVDEQVYEQLSQIAPVYAGLTPGEWDPWQDTLASLAKLTGHDPDTAVAAAEADVDTAFTDAADRLSGLQGATVQAPAIVPDGLGLATWGNDVFTRLGLVLGDGQEAGDGLSWENVDFLTADVLFVGVSGSVSEEAQEEGLAQLREDPRFDDLPASQNGTVVSLSSTEWSAINGQTPGSIAWWLDQIVPRLEESALNQSAQ